MEIICSKCKRILKNNQWVVDVPPIGKVSQTICPACQPGGKDAKDKHGMVYQEYHPAKKR